MLYSQRCSTLSWSDDEDEDDDDDDDDDDEDGNNDDDDDDFARTCVAKMRTTKATVMATAMATIVPECKLIITDQTMCGFALLILRIHYK